MYKNWNSVVATSLLLLVAIVWGTSYGVTKTSLLYVSPLIFLLIRFGLTSIFLLPYSLYIVFKKEFINVRSLSIGFITGLILLCIFMLEVFGVSLTKASNAAFLISTFVIFTPFIEWIIMKKKPPNSLFFIALMSLIGIGLITGGIKSSLNLGDILILLAGFLRAIMVVTTKKLTNHIAIPALFLTSLQSFIVVIGLVVLISTLNLPLNLPSENQFWFATLYLVIFCTIFAFFAQNYAVNVTNPTTVSILMGTEPLFGAIFAIILLNEQITLGTWIGGTLIVVSSIFLTLNSVEQKG